MLRSLNSLDRAADVELLGSLVEVSDCRVGQVVGTEDLFGLFGLVRSVDILDCIWYNQSATCQPEKQRVDRDHIPVRTARAFSSLKSLRATLWPCFKPRLLICS